MPGLKFDKSTIPDLDGRVLLVTGGTGGIGAEIVVELAKHNPGRIFFTGRNVKAAEKTTERIKAVAPNVSTTFVACDLANLATVKEAADKILAETSRLDIFLANAGIMAVPAGLSTDGYEVHFATNHMGHALLTKKLLPLLEQTADMPGSDVRVIYTTSLGWRNGTLDFPHLKTTQESAVLGRWIRYGNSKLANMLYARELARRHPKLLCFSVHPGAVETGLVNNLKFTDRLFVRVSMMGTISPEEGTFNHLWAVSAPRNSIKQGGFYEPVGVFPSEDAAIAKEKKFGQKLWEYTEKELEKWMN
ncbi:oxidoreductase [Annulohypoxylon truncatum]|uniref:oxidoreductase n=1 Tax=Annulohypoxylon truncatum TaxID=327061 RepID=UPI0020074E09|nr:oxidoreductase [Annulohypoxylon truncatum]KAI1205732.1 oxidoreductase [Annulohypoxylon truncatum]